MLPIVKQFLEDNSYYLQPLYLGGAWFLSALLIISGVRAIRDTLKRSKSMHEIPCTNCQYFTNDHRLKCAIQPNLANTELAVDCPDFVETQNIFS